MSCQQVPRIAEDPYMFTDSPITATYFTSPVQKHSFVKSPENVFSRKLNRFINKSNETFSTNRQTDNGPIYGKTKLSTIQLPSINTNIKTTDSLTENNETSKVQKRTYRRLQSTNSISDTEFKTLAAVEWETLKKKQALKPPPPQARSRPDIKKHISSINQSKVSRTIPVTFSSVIKHPFEFVDQCTDIRQKSPHPHAGQQRQEDLVADNDQSNPYYIDSIKRVDTIPEFGFVTGKKTVTIHFPTNGLSKLKKQPMPEKKGKTKGETCKKVINRRKSVANVKYSAAVTSDESNKQTALQRIPSKLTPNEIAPKKQFKRTESTPTKRFKKEWHAPESYLYDDLSSTELTDNFDITPCTQRFWFRDIPDENLLTREQRMETKRDNLRRQAFQYAEAQSFRSKILAKKRLVTVTEALNKFKKERQRVNLSKCFIQSCTNTALAMTAYCYLHITLNKDQKLFHPCTAKFSDNSQCRVPVFDISHELPLCREHAWKRDNYAKIIHEQKPRKNARNKMKSNEPSQQAKMSKKKNDFEYGDIRLLSLNTNLKPTQNALNAKSNALNPNKNSKTNKTESNFIWKKSSSNLNDSAETKAHSVVPAMNQSIITSGSGLTMYHLSNIAATNSKLKLQNILCASESSSSYENTDESSIVVLSDSELINASDGIEIPLGETRLLEEHDLTNVLNQLPEDAFNELFEVQQSDHYEPTQKEQDELARALEEVDEQVKSLEQMTGSTNFLDNFLNVDDQILVDSS